MHVQTWNSPRKFWERERSTLFIQASLDHQKLVSIRGVQIPYWSRVTTRILVVLLILRNKIQIWVVTGHQYGISVVFLTSFRVETRLGVAKCRLFSQVIFLAILTLTLMCQPEADWFMKPKILLFHSLNSWIIKTTFVNLGVSYCFLTPSSCRYGRGFVSSPTTTATRTLKRQGSL